MTSLFFLRQRSIRISHYTSAMNRAEDTCLMDYLNVSQPIAGDILLQTEWCPQIKRKSSLSGLCSISGFLLICNIYTDDL